MTASSSIEAWIIRPRANPQARLRLFCFPHAGGGASLFRSWWADLPASIEVFAIQLPGRENRLLEAPFIDLQLLVEKLSQSLLPYLNVPFALFGHSMGALISFELTRQLRRQDDPQPVHLLISSCYAPQIPNPNPPIHALPKSEFVEALRHLDGMPQEVLQDPELMQLVLPTLRADFALCETYVYSPEAPLDCPISAFGGLQDDEVSYDNLAAWNDQTYSSFKLRMFPGNHFFLDTARPFLLQAISQDLTELLKPKNQD